MVCGAGSARPRPPSLLLAVAAAAALSLLLPAAVPGPDAAHAQSMPPPAAGNYTAGNYTAGDGPGEFRAPEGVALFENGTLVVADTGNHRIQVFGPNGMFLFAFGSEGDGPGEFRAPAAVSIDLSGGRLVVADTGNHRIQVFNFSGAHVLTFGSEGNGTGELRFPASATGGINFFDDFVVADTGNHRVQTFYANGTHARTLGSHADRHSFGTYGNDSDWEFESPMAVLSRLGSLEFAVADTGNDRVQVFNYHHDRLIELTYERSLGSHGDGPREFDGPRSLDWARGSRMIVADTGNDRVQQVASTTTVFDFTFGSHGSGPGEFMAPGGASMNFAEKLAVADTGNDRVQVFHPNRTLHFILGLQGDGNGTDPVRRPPPDGNGGTPPPDGNGGTPPPDGNGGTPPPDGNGGTPPPDGNGGTPPPDGNGGTPPPDGNGGTPPPDGNGGTPPPDGNGGTPPPDGNGGTPPPDGNGGTPPPDGNGGTPPPVPPADLSHIAPDRNGMLPPNQTGISREAATVEFALRTNFTRSGTGEAYTGQINVTVASDERRAVALAALAGLGNASAAGRIGTVVEIGSPDADIALDGIAIILLQGQPPHAKLYHMDSAGRITEVPGCGSAADPAGWLGGAPASTPFCHAASGGSAEMWDYAVYTYRLSAFFAVGAPLLLPPPTGGADSCSIGLADESLAVSAAPGKASQPVRQTINNTGSLVVKSVEISATRWFLDPVGDPPHGADAASLPSTLTEISTVDPARGAFAALPADGTASLPLDDGLRPDGERHLWFRINLDGAAPPPPPPDGGLLVQSVEYIAECAAPPP